MSGTPASFACPWCGASFPFKPEVVGKPVRCPKCKNALVVQADGTARKLQAAAAPAAAAPAAARTPPAPAAKGATAPRAASGAPARAPAAPAAARAPAQPAAPVPPRPQASSSPAPAKPDDNIDFDAGLPSTPASPPAAVQPKTTRTIKRKSEHMEAVRQQLSASLKDLQDKAAASEVAKREEKRLTDRIARPGAKGKDAKREVQAVLTGEGEREGRRLAWWILGAACVLALALAWWIIASLPDARRDALAAYAAPVPPAQNRYPALGNAARARAWLAGAPSMPQGPAIAIDLDDARFGEERRIDLGPRADSIRALKGLQYDAERGLWYPAAEAARVAELVGPRRGAAAVKALAAARIKAIDHEELVRGWNLGADDAALLLDLLLGTPPADGWPVGVRMRERGEVPNQLVVLPFAGERGVLLTDRGHPPYVRHQGPYRGALLRIEGADWPRGWRLLYLAPRA